MALKTTVTVPKALYSLDSTVLKAVKSGMEDCIDDLGRVAQARTPVKDTDLEKSMDKVLKCSGSSISGTVSFSARNGNFNYAKKMNEGKYNLGSQSLTKSARGVRSKFSNQTFKVGSGYLDDTAEKCLDGYSEHLNECIGTQMKSIGLKISKK